MKQKQKIEHVIIQTVVEFVNGSIKETCCIYQKGNNISPEFRKILEDDYAINPDELSSTKQE